MNNHELTIKLKGTEAQVKGVKKAFEAMLHHFGASGVIKMEEIFNKDTLVRTIVKSKLR